MKFSEAILAGCKISTPCVGAYFDVDAEGGLQSCAIGAAILGAGVCTPEEARASALADAFLPGGLTDGRFDVMIRTFPDGDTAIPSEALANAAKARWPGVWAVFGARISARGAAVTANDAGIPREEIAEFLAGQGF